MKHLFSKIKSRLMRPKPPKPSVEYTLGVSDTKNIVYISHSGNHKSGGDKVIYRQAELIGKLNIHNIKGQVLHPENLSFSHKWFDHNVEFRKNLALDPSKDFVVIPEIWALPHAKLLHNLGVKYAIYVQNGYITNVPMMIGHTYEALYDAYNNASIILSISDDTTECIKTTFPNLKTKIQRIYYSVDAKKFKVSDKKENLITYMPRKLAPHSQLVLLFLRKSLPRHWKIEAIDGLDEKGVRDILSRSKIFLSFSEFEGCPLPPVEAALSGNQVVGYTGEGAKEYWYLPMFTEVHCGDIRNYVKEILEKIQQLDENSPVDVESIHQLAKRYDETAEANSVSLFVSEISPLLVSE